MLITSLKQCLFIVLVCIFPLNKNLSGSNANVQFVAERTLKEVTITPKSAHRHYHLGDFLGFKLQQALNTNVTSQLKEVLLSYQGPKSRISSLRRFGTRSKHCCGKAVDLEWSKEMIDYLVSPEGLLWLNQWNLTFYIEAKPGDPALLPYKNNTNYKPYVFENKGASGPHIHLNLK